MQSGHALFSSSSSRKGKESGARQGGGDRRVAIGGSVLVLVWRGRKEGRKAQHKPFAHPDCCLRSLLWDPTHLLGAFPGAQVDEM